MAVSAIDLLEFGRWNGHRKFLLMRIIVPMQVINLVAREVP